jgi:hypothetical protein
MSVSRVHAGEGRPTDDSINVKVIFCREGNQDNEEKEERLDNWNGLEAITLLDDVRG